MKRFLLPLAAVSAIAGTTFADNYKIYYPSVEGQEAGATLGYVSGVSASGNYGAIQDDEDNHAYIWSLDNPELLDCIDYVDEKGSVWQTLVYDINDEGVAVGQVYRGNGQWRPGVYKDGEWAILPVHETTLNTSLAARISNDGKYIGGIQMVVDEAVETGKGYRAARWTLNEDGDYELESFNELPKEVAHHQGFYMTDMSEDGEIIAGFIMCGATQCTIPAICKNGEYIYWNNVEERLEPWYYKGQIMGYDNEYYIDGFHDTDDQNNFVGQFSCIDEPAGKIYGMRTRAINVDDEGNGTLVRGACIYDIATEEWEDYTDYPMFSAASGDYVFTSGKTMVVKGMPTDMASHFGIEINCNVAGVNAVSDDCSVIGGLHQVMNPASGEYQYYPFIIVNGNTGVDAIEYETNGAVVNVSQGIIQVSGALDVAVYNLQGELVSVKAETEVTAGLYIVCADGQAVKVIVK